MATVGQELKRERELRGITLKEIADSTKINLRFLRALEEDQLDMLPGKFFTRGIIRAYAQYIGLEENAVLNSYYATSQLIEKEEEKGHAPKAEEEKEDMLSSKWKTIYFLFSMAVIIAIITILVFTLREKGPGETPVKPVIQSPVQKEETLPRPDLAEPKTESLELLVLFLEETWIQIYADSILKLNGLQREGTQFQTSAQKDLLIHVGNAGGIAYFINNKRGKPIGNSGDVRRDVKISMENYREFLEENDTEER